MFQFTDDCLLGVEEIDNEHRYLFDLLNKALYLVHEEYAGDRYTDIKELIEQLEDYADQHFAHEEAYMKEIGDPELILQRSQHMAFREKVTELLVRNIDEDEDQQQALEDIITFMAKWLYRHIIGSDTMIGKLPPLEAWMLKDDPCEFTDEYLIGLEHVDKQHKHLFETIGHANNLIRSWTEGDGFDEILHILEELRNYTEVHFRDEETYMKTIHYEGLEAQKRAHAAFIARLAEIDLAKVEENPREYMESLIEFLLGWLINHILQADKKIPVS